MRIQLTKPECLWLADLANKAKIAADLAYKEIPNPILELRRDNMADLEAKLNAAVQKEIYKETKGQNIEPQKPSVKDKLVALKSKTDASIVKEKSIPHYER